MPTDKFLIAPVNNTGLQTNLKPFMIPDEAFPVLTNAYVFRGRTRKRFGGLLTGNPGAGESAIAPLYSRARIQVGTIGAPVSPVPGSIFKIGQQFSAGTQVFTVYQTGTPAAMLATGPGTGTFNTTTGAFALAGTGLAAGTPIYFYPAEPILGIYQYEEGAINNQPTIIFDTQFAYEYNGTSWDRTVDGQWHDPNGTKINYYWAENYKSIDTSTDTLLFTTNFQCAVGTPTVTDDPIMYYDGTNWNFLSYSPDAVLNPGNTQPLTVITTLSGSPNRVTSFLQSSLILVAFKNCLIALNTIENEYPAGYAAAAIDPATYVISSNKQYAQRARWSHPFDTPLAQSAWLNPNQQYTIGATNVKADGAGFTDAATEEKIVSLESIKDRLIVKFERSTWELVYTGNPAQRFQWQKINTELGSESTFSEVPFDTQTLCMSSTGVLECNGSNVNRIDAVIPDEIFKIQQNLNGIKRVVGTRDYRPEMVYWTYPDNQALGDGSVTYPNKVLVYNYRNNTWAINIDCITFFGYYEQQTDLIWRNALDDWEDANYTWNSFVVAAQSRKVLAGNQQGFVFTVEVDASQNPLNMQITNMTAPNVLYIRDHSLYTGDYILISNANGVTLTGEIPNQKIFSITRINSNEIRINGTITGNYLGGGFATRVSNIDIRTKQFNPYDKDDVNVYIQKIDFLVDRTANGKVTVDYFPSSSNISMLEGAIDTNCRLSTGVLETKPYATVSLEKNQDRLWHPVYFQAYGNNMQFRIYMSNEQMIDSAISTADFQLHALILYTQRSGQMR